MGRTVRVRSSGTEPRMRTASASARGLFHSLVVMGAALGAACGGESVEADRSGAGGVAANTGGTSALGGSSGATPSGGSGAVTITIMQPNGCFYAGPAGTLESPRGPADCATPSELECGLPGGSCRCNPEAPGTATDCERTQQFNCLDWSTFCSCRCDPAAPLDATACTDPQAPFTCYTYDPPVGCTCRYVAPPIL